MSSLDPNTPDTDHRGPSAPPPAGDVSPPGPPAAPPESGPARKKPNRWLWVSAGLLVAVVGLLVWGLHTQSELDNTQQDVDQLQTQAESGSDRAAPAGGPRQCGP